MAVVNHSYVSAYYGNKIVRIRYDTVTHEIVSGTILTGVGSDGLTQDVEFYRYDSGTDHWSLRVKNEEPYAYVYYYSTAIPCDLYIPLVDVVNAVGGANGQITVTATGTGTKRYSLDGGPAQISNVFNDVLPGPHVVKVSRTEDGCFFTKSVDVLLIADLEATVAPTPCTSNGADDGKITVTILNGSGDYTIDFVTESVSVDTDGSTPTVRVSLEPGEYEVVITDNETEEEINYLVTITEPAVDAIVYPGTILDFPLLGGFKFVVANTDEEQGLDNTLLCNQVHRNYDRENYFNKFNLSDKPKRQFNSNFEIHEAVLKRYSDDTVVKTFPVLRVQQNIGRVDTFVINLEEGDPGQTLVFFNTAELPIPLSVGQAFKVKDNVDFNGTYSIVAIEIDEDTNAQYLIINKAFGAPGSTIANGEFVNVTTAFDVYETTFDFTGVPAGLYYAVITATSGTNVKIGISEPLDLQTKHEGVLLIVYSNYDNALDMTWTTGYVGFLRVDGAFGHKRPTGGERTTTRDADYSIVKVSAKKTRNVVVDIPGIPPYLHEQLSVIFDCDVFSVNNVPCQSSEGLNPENLPDSILVNSSIVVEQLNWFSKYNSNDDGMSSTSETSDCACDEIDLVPVSSSTDTITLDFASKRQRIFKVQPAFATSKTIALANTGFALSLRLKLAITQDFVDDEQTITFPANFVSNSTGPVWNTATKEFKPIDAGLYDLEATYDGSGWQLVIQPYIFS